MHGSVTPSLRPPPPKPIEDIEKEIEEELKKVEKEAEPKSDTSEK